ncbi:MAG: autotransporter domain-containing protein, partial [Desulfovibrionaceae bacterium]|nr:autotransporter domain-containing protein [Desulfovibrionaceae bacterium]
MTFDSTATGQVLTLGAGDRNNSGQIGTVTFAKDSQVFNALGNATGPDDPNAGTFKVESFAVTNNNDGTVNVSGVNVMTKTVGGSTSNVGAVKVTNGVLMVDEGANAGDSIINTKTLEVANGSVSARDGITVASTTTIGGDGTVAVTDKGDISFTGAVTMDGGNAGTTDGNITFGDALTANDGKNTVTATGDLTVTGAVTAANEGTALTLTADGGDLTLTGGADGSAPGVTLNLQASGGDITSTGAEIKATSLVATAKDDGTKGDITVTGQNITAPVVMAAGTIAAKDLTAIGADERKAIVAANKLTASGNVAVENGTFNLTGNKDDGSTDSTVTGTLNLTNAESTVAGKLDVTGAAAIDGGKFYGNNVKYNNTLDIKGGAWATYDTLEMAAGKPLTVGDAADAASTSLAVKTLKLSGSGLSASGAEGAPALVAVSDFAGSPAGGRVTADGDVTAGVNSVVGLGVDSLADLQARVAEAAGKGMSAGSTLVIGKPVAMGSNQLTVGATPGKIGADSLTIVSAATAQITKTSGGAITIDAAPGVENGARLYLPGARVGGKYAVFTTDGTTPADMSAQLEGKGWQGDNLKSDALMVNLAWNADKTAIEGELRPAGDVYPKLDKELQNVLNSAYLSGQLPDVNSDSRGVRFLSRATSAEYIGANADLAAQTIEGAARMITIGAVPQMTRAANQAAGEAVTQRTGLAQPAGIRTQEAGDHFALWIMPLYQSVNGFGMEAGNFDADFSGGLGGVAIGADYTFENAIRAGIAFNIGGGYATGGGDFADTRNNMNFWGIGAYAGWTRNNFGLAADVNFTSAYNKLGQDLPSAMGMGDLKADVRSYAFSTGLKGEYKLETSVLDIIPHVGVRYMYLTTEDYDVKSGGTVLKG